MSAIDHDVIAGLTRAQKRKLLEWVRASSSVPGWLDGYGMGRSYVDPRSGGKALAQRKAYVKLDHETAELIPELAGAHWRSVSDALSERANLARRMSPGTSVRKESFLALWLGETMPVTLFRREYWLTEERDGVRLYTAPAITPLRSGMGWHQVEGIAYVFVDEDGRPVEDFDGYREGQPTTTTFENFAERQGPLSEPVMETAPRI